MSSSSSSGSEYEEDFDDELVTFNHMINNKNNNDELESVMNLIKTEGRVDDFANLRQLLESNNSEQYFDSAMEKYNVIEILFPYLQVEQVRLQVLSLLYIITRTSELGRKVIFQKGKMGMVNILSILANYIAEKDYWEVAINLLSTFISWKGGESLLTQSQVNLLLNGFERHSEFCSNIGVKVCEIIYSLYMFLDAEMRSQYKQVVKVTLNRQKFLRLLVFVYNSVHLKEHKNIVRAGSIALFCFSSQLMSKKLETTLQIYKESSADQRVRGILHDYEAISPFSSLHQNNNKKKKRGKPPILPSSLDTFSIENRNRLSIGPAPLLSPNHIVKVYKSNNNNNNNELNATKPTSSTRPKTVGSTRRKKDIVLHSLPPDWAMETPDFILKAKKQGKIRPSTAGKTSKVYSKPSDMALLISETPAKDLTSKIYKNSNRGTVNKESKFAILERAIEAVAPGKFTKEDLKHIKLKWARKKQTKLSHLHMSRSNKMPTTSKSKKVKDISMDALLAEFEAVEQQLAVKKQENIEEKEEEEEEEEEEEVGNVEESVSQILDDGVQRKKKKKFKKKKKQSFAKELRSLIEKTQLALEEKNEETSLVGDVTTQASLLKNDGLLNNDEQPKQTSAMNNDEQPTQTNVLNNDEQPTQINMLDNDEQPTQTSVLNNDEQPTQTSLLNSDEQANQNDEYENEEFFNE